MAERLVERRGTDTLNPVLVPIGLRFGSGPNCCLWTLSVRLVDGDYRGNKQTRRIGEIDNADYGCAAGYETRSQILSG